MNNKFYMGLDNGVGTIAIIYPEGTSDLLRTPIKRCLSYTKIKNYISRFDVDKFKEITHTWLKDCNDWSTIRVGIERPYTTQNPLHKKAVVIGARIHEAQLIAVEQLGLSHEFIDSESWQKIFLPKGIKGSQELKKASLDIGKRKWPHLSSKMKKDADALFIAAYLQYKDLNPKTL